MKKLSFVIPCYRSEKTIQAVVNEIQDALDTHTAEYAYEIILVCDHSPDDVYSVIRSMAEKDHRIRGVLLAKNFGQHAALMAGYHRCTGDIIISLDDDGQTPANEVFRLIEKLDEGYDVVFASYPQKKENAFRLWGSRINDWMARTMIGKPAALQLNSYYAAKRFVIQEMLRYSNAYPYIAGLILRTTANIANVEITHRSRSQGSSGYTITKLLTMWMNGFTAFSVRPLRIATLIGFMISVFSGLYGIYTIVNKFMNPGVPIGYSALMTTILFLGGMIMLMLGLLGEYIGRSYICINQSPQYVVREETSFVDPSSEV